MSWSFTTKLILMLLLGAGAMFESVATSESLKSVSDVRNLIPSNSIVIKPQFDQPIDDSVFVDERRLVQESTKVSRALLVVAGSVYSMVEWLNRRGLREHILVWGNYCGIGNQDASFLLPPIDEVDKLCKVHDLCYSRSNRFACRCDEALVQGAKDLHHSLINSENNKVRSKKSQRQLLMTRFIWTVFNLNRCELK